MHGFHNGLALWKENPLRGEKDVRRLLLCSCFQKTVEKAQEQSGHFIPPRYAARLK